MNPGRRLKCPDCGWWGGHAMTCVEMSKENPRAGVRDKDLFEWADVDPSAPTDPRLADITAAASADADATGVADGRMGYRGRGASEGSGAMDSAALEEEARGIGGSVASERMKQMLADDIEALEATNADELAIEAPDLSTTGSREIKADFQKCSLCSINIPGADAATYTAEKRCPISRADCPFTACSEVEVEDLGKPPAVPTSARPNARGADRADTVLKAALVTGSPSTGPANLAGYIDVSPNKDRSVRKKVLAVGQSDAATPPVGSNVTVHYVGTFPESGKEFDSSRRRNAPFNFTLGDGVITGWSEGVATMIKGEKASFFLAPEKAYGKQGSPFGGIPPNAPLLFEIELLQWRAVGDDSGDDHAVAPVTPLVEQPPSSATRQPSQRGRSSKSGRPTLRGSPRNSCELQIMIVAAMGIIIAIYAAHSL